MNTPQMIAISLAMARKIQRWCIFPPVSQTHSQIEPDDAEYADDPNDIFSPNITQDVIFQSVDISNNFGSEP